MSKFLKKHMKKVQQSSREEATRRSSRLRSTRSGSASMSKQAHDPIYLEESEEESSDVTPLQVLFPHSKEQSEIESEEEEDDASSEGEDLFETRDFSGFDAGEFKESIPSNPSFNPLAIIPFIG